MNYESKPASQEVLSLYCYIGEAICAVQHTEDALSHSIALKLDVKRPFRIPKVETDKALEKYRSFTLGRAVSRAKKERLYSMQLILELEKFLLERNWLIHKSIAQDRDKWDSNLSWNDLLLKIKGITIQAQGIQHSIEEDLINFSEANGVDMARVKAEIRKHRSDG